MKQKFLSMFLTLVMAATVLPKMKLNVNAACEEVITDSIVFGLSKDTSMATVKGVSGDLPERLIIPGKVVDEDGVEYVVNSIGKKAFVCREDLKEVEVPDSVTKIEPEAFNISSIEKIKLSDNVETMGKRSFGWCRNLTTVKLPNNPKFNCIEKEAFAGCEKLGELTIPGNVEVIKKDAFVASGLETIVLPGSVKTMGEGAFSWCSKLTTAELPNNSNNCIEKKVFLGCRSLKNITIPDNITKIGERAFEGSGIEKIKLPDSVETMNERAFSDCKNLTTVIWPNDPKFNCIEKEVFSGCKNLENITLPDNIEAIGYGSFRGSGLTTIELPASVKAIGKGAFADSSLTTIILPNGVETIGEGAFGLCKKLTTVKLPNNPKFNCIEKDVFLGCTSLKLITLPGNITKIDEGSFKESGLTTIVLPDSIKTIGKGVFEDSSLTTIVLPNSVETIGEDAFGRCRNLTTVKLPNNPKYNCIEKGVFKECTSLENITLPDNITKIGEKAFDGSGLVTIVLPDSGVKAIGKGAFAGSSLTTIILPNSVEIIGEGAFSDCENLTTVIWPNDPKFNCIEGLVFAGCKMLRGITLPGNIKAIGRYSFSGSGLEAIVFPDGVETIGAGAFSDCENLTTVELPNNFKYNCIEDYVFSGCKGLKWITIPSNIRAIGYSTFSNSGLTTIELPDSVRTIGERAFSDCKNLTKVKLPSNIRAIDYSTFSNSGLTTIELPDSVRTIDKEAFGSCKNLTTVKLPSSLFYMDISAFYLSNNLRIVKIPVSLKKVEVDTSERRKKVSIEKLLQIIYAAVKENLLSLDGATLEFCTKSNPDDKIIEFDLNSISRISSGGDSDSDSDPDSDSGSDSDLDSDSDSGSDSGSDSDSDSGSDSDSDLN